MRYTFPIMPRCPTRIAGAVLLLFLGASCDEAGEILVPTVYLVAGQVGDPTSNPVTPLPGATVLVETASQVAAATTDADGNFILQGVPLGTHRLRAELGGRRATVSMDLVVDRNVVDVGLPLFTDAQIDSILAARAAPAWDRQLGLFGLFALRSTGVPLGDASAALLPSPGGTKVQTGAGEDPIVWVNANPGAYQLEVSRSGYLWRSPFTTSIRAGVVTFGAPRALPNLTGFLFANRPTGTPLVNATAAVWLGPTPQSTPTDFLGQFRFVGLEPGDYTLRFAATGFLPTLGFPQPISEDTTLSYTAVEADTLADWAAAGGAGPPDLARGHLVADLRLAAGGAPLAGARLETFPAIGVSVPQSATAPALLLDLPPGTYLVLVRAMTGEELRRDEAVTVRAGEATATRYEF